MGKHEAPAPGVDLVKVIARVAASYPEEFADAVNWGFTPPTWKSPEDRLRWVGSQVTGMLTGWSTGLSETMIEFVCDEVDHVALGTWYLRTYR